MNFEALLEESVRGHGHLCAGQVLGVRMAIAGLKCIGIDDPKGRDRERIMVYVEIDRCATDAIQSVTGCSLGKRTMKFMNFGKMAATYVNLDTGKAVRLSVKEEAKARTKELAPAEQDKYKAQLHVYRIMPEEYLFNIMNVWIAVKTEDFFESLKRRVKCDGCGEYVQNKREIYTGGNALCRHCAGEEYYILEEHRPSAGTGKVRTNYSKKA